MFRDIIAVLCIILISAMLLVGFFAYRDAGRLFDQNVVYVAPLYDDAVLFFGLADVERFRTSFPQHEISHLVSGSAVIQSQINQARASVVFASCGYYRAHFMHFKEGAPPVDFTSSVLLSEQLAWRLFGGFDVVGVPVWIHGQSFVVSGVVTGDNMGYTAWLPHSAGQHVQFSSLFIRFPYYNSVDKRVVPRETLRANSDEYMILDINRFVEAIYIRNRLILYLTWLVLLVWVLGRSYRFYKTTLQKDVIDANVNVLWRIKDKTDSIGKLVLLPFAAGFALLSVYVIFAGAIDIISTLPNFALADESLTGYLFGRVDLPPGNFLSPNLQSLFELNARANTAFFSAFIAVMTLCVTQAAKAGLSYESAGLPPLR